MNTDTLARLHRILQEKTGTIPYGDFAGQSMFQFKRSRELLMLVRTGTRSREVVTEAGLILPIAEPECEWVRQRPNEPPDGWCLARWTEPPPLEDWTKQFDSLFGYPKGGYWFLLASLKTGEEPDEATCNACAEQIEWQRSLGYHKTLSLIVEAREKKEAANDQVVHDLIDDSVVYHVPGARGGSYSVPSTKFN